MIMGLHKRIVTGMTTSSDGNLVLKIIGFFLVVGIIIGSLIK